MKQTPLICKGVCLFHVKQADCRYMLPGAWELSPQAVCVLSPLIPDILIQHMCERQLRVKLLPQSVFCHIAAKSGDFMFLSSGCASMNRNTRIMEDVCTRSAFAMCCDAVMLQYIKRYCVTPELMTRNASFFAGGRVVSEGVCSVAAS
ncbi:MAG: hypothetical protein KFH87_01995 [Bacteroidetes bacterium]|nr:hypothetical protein [Bacteroidota bacterium]